MSDDATSPYETEALGNILYRSPVFIRVIVSSLFLQKNCFSCFTAGRNTQKSYGDYLLFIPLKHNMGLNAYVYRLRFVG